jgi:molybdate transport system substrate-binding protein
MTPLRILSAGSTLHGVRALAAEATRAICCPLEITTDHGHNIRDALARGKANADVVLLPADMVAELSRQQQLRDAVALGSVGIGGAVPGGMPPPAIGTMDELRAALLAADNVMLTLAPTGDHLLRVISAMGLHERVAEKLLRFETATKLNEALASRADNAIGFAPETEIRASAGVTFIGSVPDEVQASLPYAAARLTGSTHAKALAFLEFLRAPAVRTAFAASGVRPAA